MCIDKWLLFCPGGTVDITVHEVVSENSVKEIQSASGGGWGSILVDKAFENLLIDLGGPIVYGIFKETETEDWIDLWRDFEVKKRAVAPDRTGRVNMKFPVSFSRIFKKVTKGKLLTDAIESKYAGDIEFCEDKIKFSASLFKKFFADSIENIVEHVRTLLLDEKVREIKAILMVGGYSESPMLQQAIKDACPGINVVVPISASSTILKGALVYGHSPMSIRERIMKYTYGIGCLDEFKEGIDPEDLKVIAATGIRCKVFHKFVTKGQTVKCNERQVQQTYNTVNKFQSEIIVPIFATELSETRYRSECSLIGEITFKLEKPEEKPGRKFEVYMTFSGTEIIVTAEDMKTGEDTTVYINFLEHKKQ